MCVLFKPFCYFIQISLNRDPDCLADDNSALVRIMACLLLDAKPLAEPVKTEFNDACIHHQASACVIVISGIFCMIMIITQDYYFVMPL